MWPFRKRNIFAGLAESFGSSFTLIKTPRHKICLKGELQRQSVMMFYDPTSKVQKYPLLTIITPSEAFPLGISLCKVDSFSKALKSAGFHFLRTGDRWLDEIMFADGLSQLAIALFDSKSRRAIKKLSDNNHNNLFIENSQIKIETPHHLVKKDYLERIIRLAVGLSTHLIRPGSFRDLLMINFLRDDLELVKKRNLEVLVRYFKQDPKVQTLLKQALTDNNVAVRIEAARGLGKIGIPYLEEIMLNDDEPHASQALSALRTIKNQHIIPVLEKALHRNTLAQKAAQTLGELRAEDSIEALLHLFHQTDPLTKLTVIKACGDIGSAKANHFLLQQLEQTNLALIIFALTALGKCGAVSTVEPLYNYKKKMTSRKLKVATRRAISAIQTRLGRSETGWLSMVHDEESQGALSLPTHPYEGALSSE
ncbi:HEAT repeat domain-containing protein [candidate division CSSED10-310 bacterium]|uniref:HEAT repeat domain-containing protein n=1 Tax=candidate division CSSED10-310 bacterium TaxID=2855610 RepID=A0ABV6YWK0_UNCC1